MQSTTAPRKVRVKPSDLPFACPPPKAPKWSMHPRVFLQLSPAHPVQHCPYCGTCYELEQEAEKDTAAAR